MKSTVLAIILLLAISLKSAAQPVLADPATTQIAIYDLGGTALDANLLVLDQPVIIKIPVFNYSQLTTIPGGSIQFKIGIGSKMIVDPGFNLATAPLSSYFTWTSAFNSGQVEIIGNQIAPLPGDFVGMAEFRLRPNDLLSSISITNVLISNHANSPFILSDLDGLNNTAQLQYTVVAASGPVPVNFTKVNVLKKGCNINVNFFVENEINVKHYEIETSKNGTDFIKAGTVVAASRTSYIINYPITPDMRSNTMFVRVKSVDLDGSVSYSEIKTVSGLCDAMLQYSIYPNPVTSKNLIVQATSGIFNGIYKMTVVDMRGRVIQTIEAELHNVTQYNYELKAIANGSYILRIANTDGSDTRSLPFEKL